MRESEQEFEQDGLPPSKSQRKREMHALQALGEALVALSPDRLARVPMPEGLRDAVLEAQRIRQHGARRRQLQYIGRLMRDVEAEPIQQALDLLGGHSREAVARQHRVEKLRDQLLEDEGLLHELAARWPAADLQQLRVLRRNALKEREADKPPRAYRELYRVLRELDEDGGLPEWQK